MSTTDTTTAMTNVTEADQAIKRGNRAFALRQYEEAVQAYGEASQLLGEKFGQDAPECADVLVLYGRALLHNAVEQSGVLGNDGNAMASNAENDADDSAMAPALEKLLQFMGEPEDVEDVEEGGEGEADDNDAEGEANEDEEDEPTDDFAMAWEFSIWHAKESQEKLGDVYMLLGDVSLESENFDQAYKDYGDALHVKQKIYEQNDRRLAEAYPLTSRLTRYALGCEYTNKKTEAIDQLHLVTRVLQERLKHLRGNDETESSGKGKQPETESPSESLGQSANEAEMADILNLLVEVETKIEELTQKPTMSADPLTDEVLKDTIASGSSKLVNDITMLRQRGANTKRKAEDETAADSISGDEKRTKSLQD
ncbi:hypothetical protein BDF22DRAFT_666173 [Syncephalis plumigaleata]|nr:hypothetical protein BDF22DRAFT_666173 [Syncephalis plumigaleata]